jgi:hypothetical protein
MQINFYAINFQFSQFQINTLPYTEDKLAELRRTHNTTHSFFRRDELIYISNKSGEDDELIGNVVERDVFADHLVTGSLIRHIFFRTFKERFNQYVPLDFYPFRILTLRPEEDLLYDLVPEKLKNVVGYKKIIEVQLRLILQNGQPLFGFTVNIRRNWIFNKSCFDLNSEGFPLIGVEVLHSEILPSSNALLAPNEELIGVISNIERDEAIIITNEGEKRYKLNELFIRKNKFNIGRYLAHCISEIESQRILDLVKAKRESINNPKLHLDELNKVANFLFTNRTDTILFQNKDGFCFTVNSKPLEFIKSIELKTPTFIFDHAATKTNSTNPDAGLTQFGPYDSLIFDNKSPRVLCICNSAIRGGFSNFLHSLKDGLPQSSYFKKGLQKKYDLQELHYDILEIPDYRLENYLSSISSYNEFRPNIAIVEIPESNKTDRELQKVYFQIKAKLLSLQIPVQFVTSNIVRNHNEFILNSMALQIYAKLGGTPWVLPVQKSVDRELVIGIGHSWIRDNHFSGNGSSRIVGITTFLSSDGQYLLSDKVKDVPFDNYFNELLISLRNSLTNLADTQGWGSGETVRLIFHIFKPIKDTEFEVVSQLIKEFDQFKIRFAFVTISKTHPFVMFDTNQRGFSSYPSNTVRGELVPLRGSNLILDAESCVIQMLGAKELKTSKHGMSNPILIKIRTPQGNANSDELNQYLFYDLTYITQQIFSFTYLSWRSFLPGEEPATMKYSNLISRMLGRMREIPSWDPDILNYDLKRKKWFL